MSATVSAVPLPAMSAVFAMPGNKAGSRAGNEFTDFDAFVRARLPHLLRFGRALTGSEDAAADLVQDALERTLLQWNRLDSRDRPEGYVRRIMVNRNISIWRRLRRERLTDEPPELGWRDHHRNSDLWRAIGELPPRQRAVIALRYYEDLTEAEVALVMGCSVGTVKSQAAKALAKLRNQTESFSDVPMVAPEHAR